MKLQPSSVLICNEENKVFILLDTCVMNYLIICGFHSSDIFVISTATSIF